MIILKTIFNRNLENTQRRKATAMIQKPSICESIHHFKQIEMYITACVRNKSWVPTIAEKICYMFMCTDLLTWTQAVHYISTEL